MQKIIPTRVKTKEDFEIVTSIDEYKELLVELFLIRNPKYKFDKNYQEAYNDFEKSIPTELREGVWFYFPWNKTLIHYLPENEYFELRTARNKNLITKEEQEKFYQASIGIAGLSVGSHCALTIAMMGGAKKIKLADPDKISVSNLNRIRYGASALGTNKAVVAGRIIIEINPYAEVEVYDDGLNRENIGDFFDGLQIFVEETDSLELKITGREKARDLKIPVVMATDNGDGVIVEVERYDLNPNTQLFNGALGDISLESFKNFPPQDLPKLATKVAGPEYIVPRMQTSLMEVGKTLYSWPQLGSAATLSGVTVAYIVRGIICGQKIASKKYDINLDEIFDAEYNSEESKKFRDDQRKVFLQVLGM